MTARKPSKAKACDHQCSALTCCQCKKPSHIGKPKPKGKTIRAWAVVCGDSVIRASIDTREGYAERFAANADKYDECGPHTVVPLSGTFTPGRKG